MNENLKLRLAHAQSYVTSEQGITTIGAGVLTTAAGAAIVGYGGAKAVATTAAVGGLLMAIAVTHVAAQMSIKAVIGMARGLQSKPAQQPQAEVEGRRIATA